MDEDEVPEDRPRREQRGFLRVAKPPLFHEDIAVEIGFEPCVSLNKACDGAKDDLEQRRRASKRDLELAESARLANAGGDQRGERGKENGVERSGSECSDCGGEEDGGERGGQGRERGDVESLCADGKQRAEKDSVERSRRRHWHLKAKHFFSGLSIRIKNASFPC